MKFFLILSLYLTPLLCFSGESGVVLLRSDQIELPESIGRETIAVIDRSIDTLRDCQSEDGLWKDRNAIPCAVFGTRNAPDPSQLQALQELAKTVSRPWDANDIRNASFVLLGAARVGLSPPPALLERLSRANLDALPPADCAITLLALDAFRIPTKKHWERLAQRPLPPKNTLSSVAASALARHASHPGAFSSPRPDVLAHIRWLAARLNLGFVGQVPPPDPEYPLDPENAFLIAVLANSIPRHLLADPKNALFPYNWKNHLANRIISLQQCDDDGNYFWDGPRSTLENTTLAILALQILSP
ncbi:MAG: hypothetical protein ACI4QT_10470 [Kiritimatiellia bacterium]